MPRFLGPTQLALAAAIAIGLAAGLPFDRILELLGKSFAENRLMTLFLITLPAIGWAEAHGLHEESARLIRRFRGATASRAVLVYQLFRVLHGALGIRLNGHPLFVRPLAYPMAESVSAAGPERTKAAVAAAENYGNFFGQNVSPVQAGVLLVYGVLKAQGLDVTPWMLVKAAAPMTALSIVLAAIQFRRLDK